MEILAVKRKNSGFSVVELITVITIVSILVSLLLPGISMVRTLAKNTQQKAQFATLELGIEAFKNDFGQYPESKRKTNSHNYEGGQKLAEAMVGRDMLGFHPDTDWGENGSDYEDKYYRGLNSTFSPDKSTNNADWQNLQKRKDLYIELGTANVFRLQADPGNKKSGLYDVAVAPLDKDSLVICDAYKRNKVTEYLSGGEIRVTKAGNPILYYRANLQSKDSNAAAFSDRIYDNDDNSSIVTTVEFIMEARKETTATEINSSTIYDPDKFYEFISDPKLAKPSSSGPFKYWPYNSQTYILISAGKDGLYGTEDDICNFDR